MRRYRGKILSVARLKEERNDEASTSRGYRGKMLLAASLQASKEDSITVPPLQTPMEGDNNDAEKSDDDFSSSGSEYLPYPPSSDSSDIDKENYITSELNSSIHKSPFEEGCDKNAQNDDKQNLPDSIELTAVECILKEKCDQQDQNNIEGLPHVLGNLEEDITINKVSEVQTRESPMPIQDAIRPDEATKKKRKRKNPDSPSTAMLRSMNKKLKNSGKCYVSRSGQSKPSKVLKDGCGDKCKFKCKMNISEDQRLEIFTEFWNLGDLNVQTQYIQSLIETQACEKRKGYKEKKKNSNVYYLQVENKRVRVCMKMLLSTLSISAKKVQVALGKKKTTGILRELDMRGKHTPKNKTSADDTNFVLNQINMYPAFESHYCRGKSKKKYLNPNLNLQKIYNDYVIACDKQRTPVSIATYSKLFKKLNLSFKHPYTDTCCTCDSIATKLKRMKNLTPEEKLEVETQKEEHERKFTEAYEEKKSDKLKAQQEMKIIHNKKQDKTKTKDEIGPTLCVKAFDLQKVLDTPSLSTGVSYYKRQLATYNLTIHDLATNQATCYMWSEIDGGRGSDEVASCLYKDIMSLPETCKSLILYSDNCAGQNHNFTMPLMYHQIMKIKKNLSTIEHKFLEPGHTHMECDSDHSKIERAKPKDMSIFTPHDWYNMIRMIPSGKGKKMTVIEMEHTDFLNFKSLYEGHESPYHRRLKFEDGQLVQWKQNRIIKVNRDDPMAIYLSKNIKEPKYGQLLIARNQRKFECESITIPKKYKNKLSITKKKYNDLQSLLPFVPIEHHQFYNTIQYCAKNAEIHADLVSESEEE